MPSIFFRNLIVSCSLLFVAALLFSCNSTYTSKKTGYFKIDFPQKKYDTFQRPGFPFSFEYPVYAKVLQDSTYFDSSPENPYWINIDFPQFNGRIFLSYKIVGGNAMYKVKQSDGKYKDSTGINHFDNMVSDAFNLTNKNQSVAGSIKDSLVHTPKGLTGVFFKVGGNAATPMQFFLSDTSRNFIRGALYFAVTPNIDSMKPVYDFFEIDIRHLINTFKWTNKEAAGAPRFYFDTASKK